jgi:hypothetical protein
MDTDGFCSPMRNSGTKSGVGGSPTTFRKHGEKVSPPAANHSKKGKNLRGMTLRSMDNVEQQPLPYQLVCLDEPIRALNQNETGFLKIGSQVATHQYDVEGTWKKLYTKTPTPESTDGNPVEE